MKHEGGTHAEAVASRKTLCGAVERADAATLVMSCSGPARPPRRRIGRAGHRSRVAGADMAPSRCNGADAESRVVRGVLAGRLAISLGTAGTHNALGIDGPGIGALGSSVRGGAGDEASLGRASRMPSAPIIRATL